MQTAERVEADVQQASPTGSRITQADVDQTIVSEHFFTAADGAVGALSGLKVHTSLERLTICALVLRNGHVVLGWSACVDPANFKPAVGKHLAREDAVRKIWELEGYALRERLWDFSRQAIIRED